MPAARRHADRLPSFRLTPSFLLMSAPLRRWEVPIACALAVLPASCGKAHPVSGSYAEAATLKPAAPDHWTEIGPGSGFVLMFSKTEPGLIPIEGSTTQVTLLAELPTTPALGSSVDLRTSARSSCQTGSQIPRGSPSAVTGTVMLVARRSDTYDADVDVSCSDGSFSHRGRVQLQRFIP